jgi:hypothetical protein
MAMADHMVSDGYAAVGYQYVNVGSLRLQGDDLPGR